MVAETLLSESASAVRPRRALRRFLILAGAAVLAIGLAAAWILLR